MTRKDFEIVAQSVSRVLVRSDRWLLASMLADNFEAMYPRFNRGKFIEACKPKELREKSEKFYGNDLTCHTYSR